MILYFIKLKVNLGYIRRKFNLYNSIGFYKGYNELRRKKNFNTMFWNIVFFFMWLGVIWN